MKKLIISSLLVFFAFGTFAQAQQKQDLEPTSNYLVGKFSDNWFITAGVGVQTYLSEYYTTESIVDHFSPAFEISLGKWFTPVMGVRGQLTGFNLRGYNNSSSNFIDQSIVADNGAYKMAFNYFNLHADFLFNIHSQFYNYNPERCYELIPFAGMGWMRAFDGDGARNEFAVNIGIINQFRVTDRFDIDLELKGFIVRSAIDGNASKRINVPAMATVGFSYKFGKDKAFMPAMPASVLDQAKAELDALDSQNQELSNKLNQANRQNDELNKELAKEKQKAKEFNDKLQAALKKQPTLALADVKEGFRVFFEIGKTELDEFNSANLEYIANVIKKTNRKYSIHGYADKTTGGMRINEKLSSGRAQKVYDVLVNQYGVSKDVLTIGSSVVQPDGNPALVRMVEIK